LKDLFSLNIAEEQIMAKMKDHQQGVEKSEANQNEANNKSTNQKPPAAEEEEEKCPHVSKSVRENVLVKMLPHLNFEKCANCPSRDFKADNELAGDRPIRDFRWICLTCGNVGCDRSYQAHALNHYEGTRHPLTFKVYSQECWCYACNEFIPLDSFPILLKMAEEITWKYSLKYPKDPVSSARAQLEQSVNSKKGNNSSNAKVKKGNLSRKGKEKLTYDPHGDMEKN